MSNEWVEHDGSGMPVPGDTLVYVRTRSGFDDSNLPAPVKANFWREDDRKDCNWCHESEDDQIIAYRIVKDNEDAQ